MGITQCRLKIHVVEKVPVNIQGYLYAGMPHLGLDVLDILPGGDPHAGVGVPQGVEGNIPYPRSFQGRLKMSFHHVIVIGGLAFGVGENKILIIRERGKLPFS